LVKQLNDIAVVIKYFPPGERLSGIVSMAKELLSELSLYCGVHIFCSCSIKAQANWNLNSKSVIHRVSAPSFWLSSFKEIRRRKFKKVIIISGIHKPELFFPVLFPVVRRLSVDAEVSLLQAVNIKLQPNIFNKMVLKKCKKVFFQNPQLTESISSLFNEKFDYIPPCIDLNAFSKKTNVKNNSQEIKVGFINHFNKEKGADIVVDIFSNLKLKKASFLIAGTGALTGYIQEKALNQSNIQVKGYLDDVINEIASCHIMLLPFRTSISVLGISQTLIECMACGVVVVGTKHSTLTSVLSNNINGIVCDNKTEIVDAIERLIDDDFLRERLSKQAIKDSQKFDKKNIAKLLLNKIN